ncbi:3-ketoacyl-ACP reductase [Acuticoccus sp. MNP-M23]|uniref:3-ketoacyl-ACP reductase n=1 Tax=Acuticoccus sp. MNP-M23 TaxID=3072793 RepID=UPI00281555FD|nr:3-ketoacyl-ACP reductase [Acuticoccus sp. MNP-M23]WMS41373.1 3-ketoacyl-ACP reductase [Acuticoccus sp. MNP-M23]
MDADSHRKVALVTGAGRGIGQAIAIALAKAGFDIAANDLTADGLVDTLAAVRAAGRRATPVAGDIADVASHDAMVDAAAAFGPLACLVNNAGISVRTRGDMLDVTPESFDRVVGVNLRGTFFLTQAVARRMLEDAAAGDGHGRTIITVSSANAFAASPDRAEYCLSKSALSMMTKLYAVRLAEAGIGAYEIRPGVIRTAMTAVARERYDGLYARGDFTPVNRWGEPSEVGKAAALLASGQLSFSTGDIIHVDGGMHIARV